MKVYQTENLRNVCLVGGKGVGKTTMSEALLFTAKATTRLGRVDEGNTIVDYDQQEIDRKQSLTTKIFALEWESCKLNYLDTPGYADFIGEAQAAMWVSDVACLVIDAGRQVTIGTRKFYDMAKTLERPLCFFINRMDTSRADWQASLDQVKELTSNHAVLFSLPCGQSDSFKGVIDLIEMKAYTATDAQVSEMPIPDDMKEKAQKLHTDLMETAAETDESLMDKYLETGELTRDEMRTALVKGICNRDIFPIFAGSGHQNIGVDVFMNSTAHFFPSPAMVKSPPCQVGDEVKYLEQKSDGSQAMQIFKITADPGMGEVFFLRLYSGKLSSGDDAYNPANNSTERMGHLFTVLTKERIEVPEIYAGDIFATARLKNVSICDTLCDKKDQVVFNTIPFPNPAISFSLLVKTRQEQDKLSVGVSKLIATDPTFKMHIDKEFAETIISGMGEQHIDVMIDRLNQRYGVKPELGKPHVSFRETITKKADGQGKYKKQTGGHGQYGDCWLRIEPMPRGAGFEFVNAIVGGVIPSKFIPSVEKGVREAMVKGILAEYPVEDLKVTVFDGSYHDVDSSDLAFQLAASLGFRKILESCGPQLLEPVNNVKVVVPSEFVGDVTNDLSSRRGRIQSMDHEGVLDIIKATVPLAELYKYSTSLRSITSGAGSYSMEFSHYDVVPPHMVTKIVEETKREKEEKAK
jgi:elongation factor G